MITIFNEVMTKEQVVASPKDEILNGIIIKIEKGLLSEFIPESHHRNFNNLEEETLKIHYEVNYKDKILRGDDRIAYYSAPLSNSNLGRFLNKYEELKAGKEIKIIYNDKGYGKIKLD